MANVEQEINEIETQIAKLTELRARYGALDGDVVTFIKLTDESGSPYHIDQPVSPRLVAEILKHWETFRGSKV